MSMTIEEAIAHAEQVANSYKDLDVFRDSLGRLEG